MAAVAENIYALTGLDRVKQHLGLTGGEANDEIVLLINEVSAAVESYTGRHIRSRTWTHDGTILPRLDSRGGSKLWLRESPVTSVASLKVYPGAAALTAWTGTTGDYIVRAEEGIIELVAGEWYDAAGVVEITYTAGYFDAAAVSAAQSYVYGYDVAAADLRLAVTRQVAEAWSSKDRKREGVISRSFEGVTTAYFDGAWLRPVQETLDRYRRILPSW